MVWTTLTTERERSRMPEALGLQVLIAKGRRVSLLPVRERSIGLLVHVVSKAEAIRARDRSGLSVRLGRWCATIASSLDT